MDKTIPKIDSDIAQIKFNSSISLWLQQANQQNIENLKKFQEQNFKILSKYSKGENNENFRGENSQCLKNVEKIKNRKRQNNIEATQIPNNLQLQEITEQPKNQETHNLEQQQPFSLSEEPAIWLQLEDVDNLNEESKENKQQFETLKHKQIKTVKNQNQAMRDNIKPHQDLKDYMRLEEEINQQLQFVRSKIDELKKSCYEQKFQGKQNHFKKRNFFFQMKSEIPKRNGNHLRKVKFYEIFDLITAFQFVVEKIQLINSDLIAGVSISKQFLRIWSIQRREAIFQFNLSTQSLNKILFSDDNSRYNLCLIAQDHFHQTKLQSNQQKSLQAFGIEYIKHEINGTDCNNNKIIETINQINIDNQEGKKLIIKICKDINQSNLQDIQKYQEKIENKFQIQIKSEEIQDFCIANKQKKLFLINSNGVIYSYDLISLKQIDSWKAFSQKYQFFIEIIEYNLALISTAKCQKIKIWNSNNYNLIRKLDIKAMVQSSIDKFNGKLLLASFQPSLDVYDLKTNNIVQIMELDFPLFQIEQEQTGSLIAGLDYDFQIILIRKKNY